MGKENFKYVDQSFDEIQMLRYRLKDFDRLTLQQKIYIYCLSEATVAGRDIIFEIVVSGDSAKEYSVISNSRFSAASFISSVRRFTESCEPLVIKSTA